MLFRERLIQSQAWDAKKALTPKDLLHLLRNKINTTDFEIAKKDVVSLTVAWASGRQLTLCFHA
jgi:hypothetical protein